MKVLLKRGGGGKVLIALYLMPEII